MRCSLIRAFNGVMDREETLSAQFGQLVTATTANQVPGVSQPAGR